MSLPQSWVEHLFKRLRIAYGHAFEDQYRDLDPDDVKKAWAESLAHYVNHREALTFALENLPDKPVNIMQFRNLCRQAPVPEAPMLPPPTPDPAAVASGREKLAELRKKLSAESHGGYARGWEVVRALERRQNQCERLSFAQRDWLKRWYEKFPKEEPSTTT